MKIQWSYEADRRGRVCVSGWPGHLKTAGALRVRGVAAPASDRAAVESPWAGRVSVALSGVRPGELLVLQLPSEPVPFGAVRDLVVAWDAERRRTPSGEVAWALAFDGHDGYSPTDLQYVWERANAALDERSLALMTLGYDEESDRRVTVRAPVRGELRQLAAYLLEVPVVSAELLRRLTDPAGRVTPYTWSNRLAALRRAGLLIPLAAIQAGDAQVTAAHAEAVGRSVDRRPTRLYRSVAYDLARWDEERRAGRT